MGDDVSRMRVDYDRATLTEADLAATPLAQFTRWFDAAVAAGVPEPNAMIAATADATGAPSARTVLLKGVDARGFTFFTNLGSRKSTDLAVNPAISLVFPWIAMQRQVIVIGRVEVVPRDEAAAYFATRPYGSRIGAWASRQSSPVTREELDARYAERAAMWPDDVPLPEFWGGWLVRAHSVEFWQGRSSRLHDRLRYVTAGSAAPSTAPLDAASAWCVERLSP
jgi:pyridoxamine 5'-phosphate oxidase